MKTFGIFGQGFVGNSIREGFKEFANVLTYDKYRSELSNATQKQIVESCDIIFACVPTPMDAETGEVEIGSWQVTDWDDLLDGNTWFW